MVLIRRHPTIFMGIGITILFMGIWLFRMDFLDTLELKFYDIMMKLRGDSGISSDITLIDIDDDSIEKLGRWPWPRSLLAQGITKVNAGNPKVIGLNIILSEPEVSDGLAALKGLKELYLKSVMPQTGDSGVIFLQAINEAQSDLDHDKKLAEAIKYSGKVVLPVYLKESSVIAEKVRVKNEFLLNQSIQNIRSPVDARYPRSNEITLPINLFLKHAKGIGHINLFYDPDGTARRERPIYEYHGVFIPSYTIKLAALYLNVPRTKIRADIGSALYLGSLKVPITLNSDILISFKGSTGSFKRYSFFDVLNDKVPASVFKNKIVLISPSAAGIMNPLSTPTDATMPVGEFSAHALWSILHNNIIQRPAWNFLAEILMILFIGVMIILVIPRLKALNAGYVFVGLLIVLIG
ncbi:MAG: CHASE2 domain-containing protein, partial [Desulfobacterales bacterium]